MLLTFFLLSGLVFFRASIYSFTWSLDSGTECRWWCECMKKKQRYSYLLLFIQISKHPYFEPLNVQYLIYAIKSFAFFVESVVCFSLVDSLFCVHIVYLVWIWSWMERSCRWVHNGLCDTVMYCDAAKMNCVHICYFNVIICSIHAAPYCRECVFFAFVSSTFFFVRISTNKANRIKHIPIIVN